MVSSRHRKAEALISALLRSSVSRGSDAALLGHRHVIHYRSPSSPPENGKKEILSPRSARGKRTLNILASLLRCEGARCTYQEEMKNSRASCRDSSLPLTVARGLESRRYDAKPRIFRLCYAPRSVAALTCHWHVIHYRSPSSPPENGKREI